MFDKNISRRAALMGAGAITAWAASPARAFLREVEAKGIPAFIDALLAKMTLEEKAGQLNIMPSAWGGGPTINPPVNTGNFKQQIEDAVAGKLTGVFNGNGAEMHRQLQDAVMKRSRLKIPLIFAADIIHGHRTVFPVPVGEAASFEPELAERTARVAAFEAAGCGIDWTFAPMVDIARDQRWGRTMEGSGEDVYLGMLMARARVRGFQGNDLKADEAMMACAKHFAAYGAGEGGLDYNTVDISERTLRETYLPPFEAAFDEGAASSMASFNEISGVPATGNKWLMDDVLRGEWQFDGFVVSDYTGDEEMILHGYAKDGRDAARLAISAGVDMGMASNLYYLHLPGLVRDGDLPEATLDRSVRRVLAAKAMVGLFDDPFRRIDVKREKARSRLKSSLALSREAGTKACVLLKNEGSILPLPKSGKKIALLGPFASGQHDLNGPWCVYSDNKQSVDLATGIRAALTDKNALIVEEGSDIEKPIEGGITKAVAAAQSADVIILAIGEHEGMSGEAQSRTSITVPAPQMELAAAVAATGKPVIAILKNGRALALEGAVRDADAILVSWFLGSESGHSIADILFGDSGPSGRLPVSFPFSTGQQPYYYDHKPTGRKAPPGARQDYKTQYRTVGNEALYSFGHGLTYGEIAYSNLTLPDKLSWDGEIEISATVSNGGKYAAEEVVQLYIHDRTASITRPVRQLKGFRKIRLAPGASETVSFKLRRSDLTFIGQQLKPVAEPGLFDVWIAPSAQADGVAGQFTLIAG